MMIVPSSITVQCLCSFLSSSPAYVAIYRSLASPVNPSYHYWKPLPTVSNRSYLFNLCRPSRVSCSTSLDPFNNPEEANFHLRNNPNFEEAIITYENEIIVQVEKAGRNYRRIRSKTTIDATLESIWSVLTDYERLSDIVPSLAVSEVVETEGERVRLYQVGEQAFPLGLKFSAKVVLDCFEKRLEISSNGRRRDIEFKIVDGDFAIYEGRWSIEEINVDPVERESVETCLWYYVDVKPKPWLPVQLIEGRLCKEIRVNLSCVREEAQKVSLNL